MQDRYVADVGDYAKLFLECGSGHKNTGTVYQSCLKIARPVGCEWAGIHHGSTRKVTDKG
jgi:hypothetical protein